MDLILDIGCGEYKQPGTIGVDRRLLPGVDVVCDFERGLPFKDGSVTAVYSIHSIEHMRDLITFMEELYRVCAPGARVYVRTPYYASRKAFVDPTHVRFMTEESFGPVVGIMSVENDEQAIKLMNDSRYGLTASIWTTDADAAVRIGDQVETGTWFMNRCDYLDPALAWTGVKDSGRGCTLSRLGLEAFTRPKSFHLKLK